MQHADDKTTQVSCCFNLISDVKSSVIISAFEIGPCSGIYFQRRLLGFSNRTGNAGLLSVIAICCSTAIFMGFIHSFMVEQDRGIFRSTNITKNRNSDSHWVKNARYRHVNISDTHFTVGNSLGKPGSLATACIHLRRI